MANGDEENMANGDDVDLDFRPVLPPGPTSIIFRIEAVVNKVCGLSVQNGAVV